MSFYVIFPDENGKPFHYGNDPWLSRAKVYAETAAQQGAHAVVRESLDWRTIRTDDWSKIVENRVAYRAKGTQQAYELAEAELMVDECHRELTRVRDMLDTIGHVLRGVRRD